MLDWTSLLTTPEFFQTMPVLLAQSADINITDVDTTASAGASLIQLIFFVVLYVFTAFCGQKILATLNYENPVFAWIPIANLYAYLQAGEQDNPLVWAIVSLIPFVGMIALIKIIPGLITICNRLGKTPWILLAFLVPCLGPFIVFGYLALA
jgi:hypothetical protein